MQHWFVKYPPSAAYMTWSVVLDGGAQSSDAGAAGIPASETTVETSFLLFEGNPRQVHDSLVRILTIDIVPHNHKAKYQLVYSEMCTQCPKRAFKPYRALLPVWKRTSDHCLALHPEMRIVKGVIFSRIIVKGRG